jgi:hypothetical protein
MRHRIPDQRYAEVIGAAFDALPDRIADRLSTVRFVCGVDPAFAGLHNYAREGRSYSDVAHCCWAWNLTRRPVDDRPTTVVLPYVPTRTTVVHELGHAFHAIVGFEHTAAPTTAYGATSRWEAFAEAFTTWRFWGYGDEDAFWSDRRTVAIFEELASC